MLNILISLFSSAYSDVTEDAAAEFLAFFAEKTIGAFLSILWPASFGRRDVNATMVIGMIRAPDNYVFPAPFNVVEAFLIVPLMYVLFASLLRWED